MTSNLIQDIKRSVKTVSSAVNAVPDKIVKNFDIIIDGLSGGISHKDIQDDMVTNSKVGAGLEHDDNIPLRITLRYLKRSQIDIITSNNAMQCNAQWAKLANLGSVLISVKNIFIKSQKYFGSFIIYFLKNILVK